MSINVDFLFVDQQMQNLFQHQSANRTSSSSTKLNHPICTTSAICIIPLHHVHLHSWCTTSAIAIIPVHHAHLHSWCTTSAIAIIPVQHAHLHSLFISSAMDKLFQAMCNIPNQHALLIQPKCTIPDQHALLIQPKCTILDKHTQHCHTFSTTPVQHAQLQSKCTLDPYRIIQSNCTTKLR